MVVMKNDFLNSAKGQLYLGIGKTGRGAGLGDFLVKPGAGRSRTQYCYFCTKDGLLMQKRTHASSLPSFQT